MSWSNVIDSAPAYLLNLGMNAAFALLILFIGKWLAGRLVALAGKVMTRRGVDSTVTGFVGNILYLLLLGVVVIAAMSRLGIPTASFIAVIGAAGLAVGLALQGSLANFASGVLLVTFRPCKVGDYIEAASVSGTVEKITVFSTTLIMPDQRTVILPNAKLLDGAIVNYSTQPIRRLDLTIGISYESELLTAKALLRSVVEADERVLKDRPVVIGVAALGESSVEFTVRPWVPAADYLSLRLDLLEKIKISLEEAGIVIPYPQMDVHVRKIEESLESA